jgi:hypothetical protein
MVKKPQYRGRQGSNMSCSAIGRKNSAATRASYKDSTTQQYKHQEQKTRTYNKHSKTFKYLIFNNKNHHKQNRVNATNTLIKLH